MEIKRKGNDLLLFNFVSKSQFMNVVMDITPWQIWKLNDRIKTTTL
jgi:hypothetical protein